MGAVAVTDSTTTTTGTTVGAATVAGVTTGVYRVTAQTAQGDVALAW